MPSAAFRRPRRLATRLLLALPLAALVACTEEGAAVQGGSGSPIPLASSRVARDIRDLITAVTPFAPTVSPAERNAWHGRRKETLRRLREAGPEYGLEALRVYGERTGSLPEIRVGLLDIAAHGAPVETRPLLVELITVYGEHIFIRTKATDFLARTSPETAIEVIQPILANKGKNQTYPPQERMLAAWSLASKSLDRDRIPFLCELAVDLNRSLDVRHLAVRLLGEEPSAQGRQALERLLVESSGNSYLRRLATQSLRDTISAEELCPLLLRVLDNEVDPGMQIFLDDTVQKNCR